MRTRREVGRRSSYLSLKNAVTLTGLVLAQGLALTASGVILNDGAVHIINDLTYYTFEVEVTPSPSGDTTSLILQSPASLGTTVIPFRTLSLSPTFLPGYAEAEIQGGDVNGSIRVQADSCLTIDGGTVGISDSADGYSLNIGPDLPNSNTAYMTMNAGSLTGGIDSRNESYITITGGSIGAAFGLYSLTAENHPYVRATGGQYLRGWKLEEQTNAIIRDGSYGSFLGPSVFVHYDSRLEIHGGTFDGPIEVKLGSAVSITGGSFGVDAGPISLYVNSFMEGYTAEGHVSGGTFAGGVQSSFVSTVRITGGSFGFSAGSVAVAAHGGGAQIEIFGGSYSGSFRADQGDVHVYGQGLSHVANQLTGTLGDGTPINVPTSESFGSIFIHSVYPEIPNVLASALLLSAHRTAFRIPNLMLLRPGCNDLLSGDLMMAMEGEPLGSWMFGADIHDTGVASMILVRGADADAPPIGEDKETVPVEMVALQLVSVAPVLLPDGSEQRLAVTLQSDRERHPTDPPAGSPSTGAFTIRFGTRSFETALEIFYDIRAGSVNGPILFSGSDSVETTGPVPWTADAPSGALVIPGVNEGLFPAMGDVAFDLQLTGTSMELLAGVNQIQTVSLPMLGPWSIGILVSAMLLTGLRRATPRGRRLAREGVGDSS